MKENLDEYFDTYDNDPYLKENMLSIKNYMQKCVTYAQNKDSYLELGLGHGAVLEYLDHHYKKVLILEGSHLMVKKYENKFSNIAIQEIFFEDFATDQKFDNIGMGFVLEHVDDPGLILDKYRNFLVPDGNIFVAVPNASSLHRVLANKAGMLDDIQQMSEMDIKFGHKRFLAHTEWFDLFKKAGLRVERSEGLYLKPFTTDQISSLSLDNKLLDALTSIASDYPVISNSIFYQLKNDN